MSLDGGQEAKTEEQAYKSREYFPGTEIRMLSDKPFPPPITVFCNTEVQFSGNLLSHWLSPVLRGVGKL